MAPLIAISIASAARAAASSAFLTADWAAPLASSAIERALAAVRALSTDFLADSLAPSSILFSCRQYRLAAQSVSIICFLIDIVFPLAVKLQLLVIVAAGIKKPTIVAVIDEVVGLGRFEFLVDAFPQVKALQPVYLQAGEGFLQLRPYPFQHLPGRFGYPVIFIHYFLGIFAVVIRLESLPDYPGQFAGVEGFPSVKLGSTVPIALDKSFRPAVTLLGRNAGQPVSNHLVVF